MARWRSESFLVASGRAWTRLALPAGHRVAPVHAALVLICLQEPDNDHRVRPLISLFSPAPRTRLVSQLVGRPTSKRSWLPSPAALRQKRPQVPGEPAVRRMNLPIRI